MSKSAAVFALCLCLGHFYQDVSHTLLAPSHQHVQSNSVSRQPGTAGYDCYKHMCRCYRDVADCSRNYGNLTFIPRLPNQTRLLNFSYNDLREIVDVDFFVNVTQINGLNLSDNDLGFIAYQAFGLLKDLSTLLLVSNARLNNSALPAVLSVTTLGHLELRDANLTELRDDIFYTNPLPRLHKLYLHNNRLNRVNLSAFEPLVQLTRLGLRKNHIYQVSGGRLGRLEVLQLGSNRIDQFPVTCRLAQSMVAQSMFPRLEELYLDDNNIAALPADICLPRLKLLDVSENYIVVIPADSFSLDKFPQLIQLFVERTRKAIQRLDQFAFRNSALQQLSLMYNSLDFSKSSVSPSCFAGCTSLTHLLLGHNFFNEMTAHKWQALLGNLTSLEYIFLEYSEVLEFPAVLSTLTRLHTLVLSGNSVPSLPDGALDAMPGLREVRLDINQISVIRQTTFAPATRKRLSHLDLSQNPFTCSCDVMWFRNWFVSNQKLFQHSWSKYHCANVNKSLSSFYLSEQACLLSGETYAVLTVSLSILLFALTLGILLYPHRWHLRLMLFHISRARSDVRTRHLQQEHFLYDVFVSYASEDLPWVRRHLIPELEEGLGLRLCLHERDFILGNPIVDNIEESVQRSKKVLMLFSTHFARSQWCQFELTLCLSHVMDHEVLLHDIPPHVLTSAMMAVLRTTTYIEWDEHPQAVACFWGRMQIALQEILAP